MSDTESINIPDAAVGAADPLAVRMMICKSCGEEVPFEKTNDHTGTHRRRSRLSA